MVKINNVRGYRIKAILEPITPKLEPTDILKITVRGRGGFAVSPQELASEAVPLIVPRKEGGKYDLALPGYGGKGQLLEEMESIEAISLKQKAMMYVVGVGCGDPNLLTMLESLAVRLLDLLDRHDAAQASVPRLPHFSIPPAPIGARIS